MKRFAPVVIVLVLIGALAYVNRGISKTAPPDHDDDDAPPPAAKATTPSPAKPAPATGLDALLQPELTVGNWATAKHKITVGWMYDEANQSNPKALTDALAAVQQYVSSSHGSAAAEIVDLDVPAEDRSPAAQAVTVLGVQVDGKEIGTPANPGEPGLTADAVTQTLKQYAPE